MRIFRSAALVAAAASVSVPAVAASIVNPNGTVTLEPGSPLSWTFDYNGFSDGTTANGLTAQIQFNFLNRTGNTYNFSYTLKNTSVAPITSARIVAFGFNTDPDFTSASTGANDQFNIVAKGQQPNGLPTLDFCLKDSSNATDQCTSGQAGLEIGQQAGGTFALTFGSAVSPLTLSNFSVRYQDVAGAGRITSANGVPVPGVPEPAVWAMMIGGFGVIGAVSRRRRATIAYA